MKSYHTSGIRNYEERPAVHLGRRECLKNLMLLPGGMTVAWALLNQLGGRLAMGAVVAADDPRLDLGYITYPGQASGIRAYSARPVGREELPGVVEGFSRISKMLHGGLPWRDFMRSRLTRYRR